MKIEALRPLRLNGADVPQGKVEDVPDDLGRLWISKGWAKSPGSGTPKVEGREPSKKGKGSK